MMIDYRQKANHSIKISVFRPRNNKVSPSEINISPMTRATMPKNKISQVRFDKIEKPKIKEESK